MPSILSDPMMIVERLRGIHADQYIIKYNGRQEMSLPDLTSVIRILEEYNLTIVHYTMYEMAEPSELGVFAVSPDIPLPAMQIAHRTVVEIEVARRATISSRAFMGGYGPQMRPSEIDNVDQDVFRVNWRYGPTTRNWRYEGFPSTMQKTQLDEEESKYRRYHKAKQLFMSLLSGIEQEELRSFSTITIPTGIGLFRITTKNTLNDVDFVAPSHNVKWKSHSLCLVIKTDNKPIPYYDHIIMQLLLLKSNPEMFTKLANHGSLG